MRKEHNLKILKQNLKTSFRKSKLRRKWVFQMDKDHKHPAKVILKWLKDNKVSDYMWPSLSSQSLRICKKI